MHGGPADLYRGTGGRSVPDMPSPMSRARVSCIACHKQLKNSSGDAAVLGQTFVAIQDSCNTCHGTKYATVLDTWKGIVSSGLDNAEAKYLAASESAKSARNALSSTDQLKVARLLDDADHNIRLVKLGHGVHNVNYSVALLNQAMDSCQAAQKLLEPVLRISPAGGSP
jgi:formate-dependent nitrite reductase cytochrome c552 subunit